VTRPSSSPLTGQAAFGADHANVAGPYRLSGQYGPRIMPCWIRETRFSLPLVDHGGHLSHGQAVNFSGRYYRVHHYALDRDTELLDYESARKIAHLYRPKLIVVGFSAYPPRVIDWEAWRLIADEV